MSGENTLTVNSIDGRPSLIVYETQSGVIFHIKPLNLATLRAIQVKAADLFPYPEKRPYQHIEENGFSPEQLSDPLENPDYVQDCAAVDAERKVWVDRAVFNYATTCPKYPTPEAMVAAFKPQLDKLREIAKLPEDDLDAVLFHLVLTWNKPVADSEGRWAVADNEYAKIIRLAIQVTPLTAAEVAESVKYFRPVL